MTAVERTAPRSAAPASARPFAEVSRSLLRETVLDAVDRLLAERSWSAVTMGQVATAAGVSRQTVYNEFGNRAELARAYAIWSAHGLLDDVERSVAEHRDDLVDALVSTFAALLAVGHRHPLIRALGGPAAGGGDPAAGELATALVSGPRSVLVVVASERLAGIIGRTWPALPTPTVAAVSEVLVRLAVSHLLLPTAEPDEAAAQVAAVLSPLLERLQAG